MAFRLWRRRQRGLSGARELEPAQAIWLYGRCFACSNFLISLRTQCAYIPYTHIYIQVAVCMCKNFLLLFWVLLFLYTYICIHIHSYSRSAKPTTMAAKRRGTYFNCSLFGHEVHQLSAKLAIVLFVHTYIYLCIYTLYIFGYKARRQQR